MRAFLAAALLATPPAAGPVRKLDLELHNFPSVPVPPPRKPVAQKPAAQAIGFRDETRPMTAGSHFLGGGVAALVDSRPH